MKFYKRDPRAFVEGTVGLSFEAKGAYAILLDLIYIYDGRLPDDAKYIAGVLNCSVRLWKTLRITLWKAGKIHISDGVISNFRADFEIENAFKIGEKNAENRARPNKNSNLKSRNAGHTRARQKLEERIYITGRLEDTSAGAREAPDQVDDDASADVIPLPFDAFQRRKAFGG